VSVAQPALAVTMANAASHTAPRMKRSWFGCGSDCVTASSDAPV
jgi:hypothetical protein